MAAGWHSRRRISACTKRRSVSGTCWWTGTGSCDWCRRSGASGGWPTPSAGYRKRLSGPWSTWSPPCVTGSAPDGSHIVYCRVSSPVASFARTDCELLARYGDARVRWSRVDAASKRKLTGVRERVKTLLGAVATRVPDIVTDTLPLKTFVAAVHSH